MVQLYMDFKWISIFELLNLRICNLIFTFAQQEKSAGKFNNSNFQKFQSMTVLTQQISNVMSESKSLYVRMFPIGIEDIW